MTSAEGPSLAGPISEWVVNPEALECSEPTKKLRENTKTCPLPRPATYEAGAGMDKNASLLGFPDAMMRSSLLEEKSQRQGLMSRVCHTLNLPMTAITQNLPWFIKDLGISIVGKVCSLYSNTDEKSHQILVLGMLHVTG